MPYRVMKKFTFLCGLIIALIISGVHLVKAQNFLSDSLLSVGNKKGKIVAMNVFKAVSKDGTITKGDPVSELEDAGFDPLFLPGSDIYSRDSIADFYDKKGVCVKRCYYYPTGELKESRTFSYDNKGKLTSCIIRQTSEETVDAISYSYDPYGRLALKVFHRKGAGIYQQRFAYDLEGNWVVRVDFREYEPVFYVERTILYED